MKLARLFLLLLTLSWLSACATTHQFPSPTPAWKTYVGQLRYSNPQRSIIGEFVVRSLGREQFQLEFRAGPGVPLISLKQDGDAVSATGPLSHGGPGHLRAWTALRERFAALPPGAKELRSENPQSGERFLFLFSK